MMKRGRLGKRTALTVCLLLLAVPTSGCIFSLPLIPYNYKLATTGFGGMAVNFGKFWKTGPLIPVSPYYSQLIEDTYWEEERYDRVPVLDPVEGEHAPLFCVDPPSDDEIMRKLPDKVGGGLSFVAETTRNNVRITTELIVDRLDECKFYPMVGPARLHHCHYKCTVYYEKVRRSSYPVPFTAKDDTVEVIYIDHDHLIRCAGPPTN